MSARAHLLVRVGVVVGLLSTLPLALEAGVRVDEPGPPHLPRMPLPADYRRSSSLQLLYGVGLVDVLGFGEGGPVGQLVYERRRSPRSSWIVRASRASAEDLVYRGLRFDDPRYGLIRRIGSARMDVLECGARASSHGANAFYVEGDAGIARTRLDGVVFDLSATEFRLERRVRFQLVAGACIGHVWQPVRFPLGLLVEAGYRSRFGAPRGSDVSARIGLLGQRPAPAE